MRPAVTVFAALGVACVHERAAVDPDGFQRDVGSPLDAPAMDVAATDVLATDVAAADVLAVLATDVLATDVSATDVSATDAAPDVFVAFDSGVDAGSRSDAGTDARTLRDGGTDAWAPTVDAFVPSRLDASIPDAFATLDARVLDALSSRDTGDAARDAPRADAPRDAMSDARAAPRDTGRDASADASPPTRAWGFCGDGIVQRPEQCDDGPGGACSDACLGGSGLCAELPPLAFATEAGARTPSRWTFLPTGSSDAPSPAATTDEAGCVGGYLRLRDGAPSADGWISVAASGCGIAGGANRISFLSPSIEPLRDAVMLAIGTDNRLTRVWFVSSSVRMELPITTRADVGEYSPIRHRVTLPAGLPGQLEIEVEEAQPGSATENNTGLYLNRWAPCPT